MRLYLPAFLYALVFVQMASAQTTNLKVTFVARVCPNYTDVMANRSRNNIMESLKDLGPDSIYQDGDLVSVAGESSVASQTGSCMPLGNWRFALGEGFASQKDTGVFGALSKINKRTSTSAVTQNGIPELNSSGQPTGRTLDGAVTVTLSQAEVSLAQSKKLVTQGGVPGDPLLGNPTYGFASMRCSNDNKNADNVEYVRFPASSVRHVFCYAYYVNPAPFAGTIIISKAVAGATRVRSDPDFIFGGNISYNAGGSFSLKKGQSQSFIRAAGTDGTVWTINESPATLPEGYSFRDISCTASGPGGSSFAVNGSSVDVTLRSGDTVTCTFTNVYTPPFTSARIDPILECTARDSASSYTAYFGFYNREAVAITVPPGDSNRFSPAPANRGQPSTFLPGRQTRVFSTSFDGSPITWTVNTSSVTASSAAAQRCQPTCLLPSSISLVSCDGDLHIDGSSSGTLNNGGVFSSFEWSTDCEGTLIAADTLRPVLHLSSTSPTATRTCSVTLKVTDDTQFGTSNKDEVRSASCSLQVNIPPCTVDCAGIPNGSTNVDACGVCGGDNSTCLDCAGNPNGGAAIDQCGVCGGNNSTCADCAGIPNGSTAADSCGVCGGDGTTCIFPPPCPDQDRDGCGVCGGDGSTCLDCAGIPNGKTTVDTCGVCGGHGEACAECFPHEVVNFNESQRVIRYRALVRKLRRNANRYAKEARACDKSSRRLIERREKAVDIALENTYLLLDALFGTTETVCGGNLCREISISLLKTDLRQIGRTLRKLSVTAQRIVAGCRAERRGGNEPTSRDLYQSLLDVVGEMPNTLVACNRGQVP